jgi:hypothetical protein
MKCDIHSDKYECPDSLVVYSRKYTEYGIIIHDGGTSYILIKYCPWCGAKLPESTRDAYFDKIEMKRAKTSK